MHDSRITGRLWCPSLLVSVLLLSSTGCAHKGYYHSADTPLYPPGQGNPPQLALPVAGVDEIGITMSETYEVEGVGRDTVTLEGKLVTRRGHPLFGHGEERQAWGTSTVVAEFTSLDLKGESKIFGPVHVSLNTTKPTFAIVRNGRCVTAVDALISMPQLNRTFFTSQPVQLQSTVTTIPPVGDQRTASVNAVNLVDSSGRVQGKLLNARVSWRTLLNQVAFGERGPQ